MPLNGRFTALDDIEDLIATLNKAVNIVNKFNTTTTKDLGRFRGKHKTYTLNANKDYFEDMVRRNDQVISLIGMVRDELLRNSKPSSPKIMRSFEDFKVG